MSRTNRSQHTRHRSRLTLGITFGLTRAVLFASCFAWLAAPPASAQDVSVYASYGAADPGPGNPIGLLPQPSVQIHLWAYGGPNASSIEEVCDKGSGDEICGVFLNFQAQGFEFLDFAPDANFDSSGAGTPFQSSQLPAPAFNTHGFDLGTPTPVSRLIGVLTLDASSADTGSSVAVEGKVIASNTELRSIASQLIVVPEPSLVGGLISGATALGFFARSARKRRRR